MERDDFATGWIKAYCNFNSHAHVERDISAKLGGNKLEDFNSHAHVERDYDDAEIYHYKANFNSHAHVERDDFLLSFCDLLIISTHTLTWSVTWFETIA